MRKWIFIGFLAFAVASDLLVSYNSRGGFDAFSTYSVFMILLVGVYAAFDGSFRK